MTFQIETRASVAVDYQRIMNKCEMYGLVCKRLDMALAECEELNNVFHRNKYVDIIQVKIRPHVFDGVEPGFLNLSWR